MKSTWKSVRPRLSKFCQELRAADIDVRALHKPYTLTLRHLPVYCILTMAIPSELDEGIDFSDIEEKCVVGQLFVR